MQNNEILIIYNFFNFVFTFLFLGISLLYLIALTYSYIFNKKDNEGINLFNISVLKYYVLSIVWVITVYFFNR